MNKLRKLFAKKLALMAINAGTPLLFLGGDVMVLKHHNGGGCLDVSRKYLFALALLLALNASAQTYPPKTRTFLISANGANSGVLRGQDYAGAYQAGILNYYAVKAFGITSTGTANTYYAGLWYLFGVGSGANPNTMKWNFINPGTYNIVDVNTCTGCYTASGISTAGGSKCASLSMPPQSGQFGLMIYLSACIPNSTGTMIGTSGTAGASYCMMQSGSSSTIYQAINDGNGGFSYFNAALPYVGNHFLFRRASPATSVLYYEGTSLVKTYTTTAVTPSTFNIYIGAENQAGTVSHPITQVAGYIATTTTEPSGTMVSEMYNINEKVRTTIGH